MVCSGLKSDFRNFSRDTLVHSRGDRSSELSHHCTVFNLLKATSGPGVPHTGTLSVGGGPSWALWGTEQHPWPHPHCDNHRCPQTSPSVPWVENHSWDGSHSAKGLQLLKLSLSHPRLMQKPPPSPGDKDADTAELASHRERRGAQVLASSCRPPSAMPHRRPQAT